MIRRAARRLRASMEALAEGWARGPIVLLYHRIAEERHDPFGLCVSPANFAAQLELLAAEHEPVSLGELVARVRAGAATRREVAITFDDGYVDNLEVALPLLQRRGIPATFFISSGQVVSGRGFWWDELEAALRRDPKPASPHLAFQELHDRLVAMPPAERDAALAAILEASPDTREAERSRRPLTASEVRAIAADPRMEIGAHSVHHAMLTALGAEERRAEIRQSRADLEAMAGRPVRAFAYPYGYFDDATVGEAREQGIELACTCGPRRVRRTDDALRLPRLEARDCGAGEFARALAFSLPRRHPVPAA
jgi:peptidoglycan/xylan/chitin deacetylase (PgdA/CDA1 family)